jgi:hypothetical protein
MDFYIAIAHTKNENQGGQRKNRYWSFRRSRINSWCGAMIAKQSFVALPFISGLSLENQDAVRGLLDYPL